MGKDKEHKDKEHKKEKKAKKVRTSELHSALSETSADIILTPTKKSADDDEEDLYESRLPAQAAFAQPLANKKLNKKVLKTIKKGISTFFCLCADTSFSSEGVTKRCQGSREGPAKRGKGVCLPTG